MKSPLLRDQLIVRLKQRLTKELDGFRESLANQLHRPLAVYLPLATKDVRTFDHSSRHEYNRIHKETLVEYGRAPDIYLAESLPKILEYNLPSIFTVDHAIDWLEQGLSSTMADEWAHTILACVQEFVGTKFREAVLSREALPGRWPVPEAILYHNSVHLELQHAKSWLAFYYLRQTRLPPPPPTPIPSGFAELQDDQVSDWTDSLAKKRARETTLLSAHWPSEVAFLDAAKWAKSAINRLSPSTGDKLLEAAEKDWSAFGISWRGAEDKLLFLPAYGLGLLYLLEDSIIRESRRPSIALDSGNAHREVMEGFLDLPKDVRRPFQPRQKGYRVQLLNPENRSIQLSFNLGDLNEAMVQAIKALRGWRGLRSWAAFQRLLSIEGKREGWVRWTLDHHLEAMGYSRDNCTRQSLRDKIANEVELLTKLELAVLDDTGKERERRPLILIGSKHEQLVGSKWRLDGMELHINPLIYGGVRRDNGKIGTNFYPAPIELAQVDHNRHPHTIALGLLLPPRWRMAKNCNKEEITLSGANLLKLAGIKFDKRRPGQAFRRLAEDLEELKRIGGLGGWAWNNFPNTLAGMVTLYPAPWAADRIHRGVAPQELPLGPCINTGEELTEWRTNRGWSQSEAALGLGISQSAISRAEAVKTKAIPRKLASILRSVA